MKHLATVIVPHYLPQEETKRRQDMFDRQLRVICEKYRLSGADYKSGFIFNERGDIHGTVRDLWEFDKKWHIPMEMQKELATEWVKLFQ